MYAVDPHVDNAKKKCTTVETGSKRDAERVTRTIVYCLFFSEQVIEGIEWV